jgi:hypothetical protein
VRDASIAEDAFSFDLTGADTKPGNYFEKDILIRDWISFPTVSCTQLLFVTVSAKLEGFDVSWTFELKPGDIPNDFYTFANRCVSRQQFWAKRGPDALRGLSEDQTVITLKLAKQALERYAYWPSLESLSEIAAPDPEDGPPIDPDGKCPPRLFEYLVWCDEAAQKDLLARFVRERNTPLGRMKPIAFLMCFIRFSNGFEVLRAIEQQDPELWKQIERRFPNAHKVLQGPKDMEDGYVSTNTGKTVELDQDWNTQKWSAEALEARKQYCEDRHDTSGRPEVTATLEAAILKNTACRGELWYGSPDTWPEDVIESGEKLTPLTTDRITAARFALGREEDQDPENIEYTDADIPNAANLYRIEVWVPTQMVSGTCHKGEVILPPHVRLRFLGYSLYSLHLDLEESEEVPSDFVFLVREYAVEGVEEKYVPDQLGYFFAHYQQPISKHEGPVLALMGLPAGRELLETLSEAELRKYVDRDPRHAYMPKDREPLEFLLRFIRRGIHNGAYVKPL